MAVAICIFYYIQKQIRCSTKYKLEINIFKRELNYLLSYQKLYILFYQYCIVIRTNPLFINIYGGEKIFLVKLATTSESYFWEPYTIKGEEELWKSLDRKAKTAEEGIKKKTKVSTIPELDKKEETTSEASKLKVRQKVKCLKTGIPILAWTVPTWFYYKQKYEMLSLKYDIELYFRSEIELRKAFTNLIYYKEVYTYFIKNLHISLNSFWLLRFLSLYTKHYTQNRITWAVCIPELFTALQGRNFLNYYRILLLTPKVYKFLQLLENEGFCIMYTLLINKNILLFISWVSNYLKTLGVKNYKRFLRLLKSFLDALIIFSLKYQLLYGYQFILRGKLMGGGSTRKKHLIFNAGQFSLSSKKLSFNYKKFIIKTGGGIISGEFRLFFRICLLLQFYTFFIIYLFFFIFFY